MRLGLTILLVALVVAPAKASEPLERLRAHAAVDLISRVPGSAIASHYSSNPKELGRSALNGNDLYLFPDGTYLYSEWGDLEPVTIRDKGRWTFSTGTIKLISDPEVTWDAAAERSYLVVHRQTKPREILLIGLGRALSYFEEKADDDPNFMLLMVAKTRTWPIGKKSAASVKAKLMRDAWRPEYFHSGQK